MTSEQEWAWAAGLFEGEGTVYYRINIGRCSQRAMALSSTDRDVVERFAAIVGAGTIRGPLQQRPNHKPMHRWAVYRWEDMERIALALLPFAGVRRAEKLNGLMEAAPTRYIRAKRQLSLVEET